jgi:hypothetical protein
MSTPANSLNIQAPGYVVFDGVSVFTGRTFQAGTGITISNASGISGNTTISVTGGAAITSVSTTNATPQFVLSGSTEVINFGINNLILGSNPGGLVVGNGQSNVGFGFNVLNALTSGSSNVAVGYTVMQSTTTGSGNSGFGFEALDTLITGNFNSGFGYLALGSLTNTGIAGNNTGIGSNALQHVQTGVSNIGLGYGAGISYLTSESSNIMIGNAGVVTESNVIRIGTQGSGIGQQTQTYIAGVINTVSGRVVKTTAPGAYPYLTLTTDYVILVDTASARTINLVASPVTGTTYRIKDNVGSAAANNITITPNAGTIDGAASYTISSNWGSIDLIYQGTSWRVL